MTYALAPAFQSAVFDLLNADTALQAEIAGALFDALPPGPLPELYVTLGAEEALDRSVFDSAGALHRFTLSIRAETAGFARAKAVAALICDALLVADLTLSRGHVVDLWFETARAERMSDGTRRVSLRFAARLEDG